MIQSILTFGARHRIITVALLVSMVLAAAGGVFKLQIDTSYDSLISESDPGRADYNRTIKDFGSDNTTIIRVTDDELFTAAKLEKLDALVQSLKEIKAVERVDSLFSVISIRDRDGTLDARPLMDFPPMDDEEAAQIKNDATFSPLIRRNLVSENGTSTAINVTVVRDFSDLRFNHKVYDEIEKRIQAARAEFDEITQVGSPRLNVEIETGMFKDLSVLTPLSTAVLIGSIILMMKIRMAPLIPMLTAGTSIILTIGFMGYMDLKLTLLTAIVPSLIIVIGSTEDMHLLASYLEGLLEGGEGDRKKAVSIMAKHVGIAVFLTGTTTAIGFYSNAVSDIPLIKDFAYASAFGMIANTVVTILAVPLILSMFGPLKNPQVKNDHEGRDEAVRTGLIGWVIKAADVAATRFGRHIAVFTAVIVVVFGYLATQVHVSNDPLSYFKDDHPLVQEADRLHADLSGMQIFYVTLDAGQTNAFREPENLKRLEALTREMQGMGVFDKVLSLSEFLSLVNQEMRGSDKAAFRVPEQRDLVDQYVMLFSRQDLDRYVTSDFSRANIIVRHNLSDSHELNGYLAQLDAKLPQILGPGISYSLTGENLMINRAAEGLFSGQVESLALVGAVIFVMMSILYTSPFAGLMFLIPNLVPLVMNFGVMALLDIPLNPGTASVAAIALGIAVDDTIHLFARYRAEVRRTGHAEEAVRATVRGEAVAVMTTSVSLMAMYAILLVSNFAIVVQFGLLAGLTMLYALLSDLFLTPLILKRIGVVGVFEMASLKVHQDVIDKSPLFKGMSRHKIKKTILLSRAETFEPGQEIIREGTLGRQMFVLLSGSVEVLRETDGRMIELGRLQPGDVFGEIGYLGEFPRTATVRALEATEVLMLDSEAVNKGLRFHSGIASLLNLNISRILGDRVVKMSGLVQAPAKSGEVNA